MKLKKKRGEFLDHVVIILMGIFSAFAIIISSINSIGAISKYMDTEGVTRKYLLRMESHGYLSLSDAQELKEKLSSMGLSNVDLTGTTFNQVKDGGDIFLDIKYSEKVKTITLTSIMSMKFQEEEKSSEITLSSTAKD